METGCLKMIFGQPVYFTEIPHSTVLSIPFMDGENASVRKAQ